MQADVNKIIDFIEDLINDSLICKGREKLPIANHLKIQKMILRN
jgi:hypothetical protein